MCISIMYSIMHCVKNFDRQMKHVAWWIKNPHCRSLYSNCAWKCNLYFDGSWKYIVYCIPTKPQGIRKRNVCEWNRQRVSVFDCWAQPCSSISRSLTHTHTPPIFKEEVEPGQAWRHMQIHMFSGRKGREGEKSQTESRDFGLAFLGVESEILISLWRWSKELLLVISTLILGNCIHLTL